MGGQSLRMNLGRRERWVLSDNLIQNPAVLNVLGEIESPSDASVLTQDMLEVHMRNGVVIDVGWYPEHDPKGCYYIRPFFKVWDHQLLSVPLATSDRAEACRIVEYLAVKYSSATIAESASQSPPIPEPVQI